MIVSAYNVTIESKNYLLGKQFDKEVQTMEKWILAGDDEDFEDDDSDDDTDDEFE